MFVNTAMEGEEAAPPAEPLRRKAATEATINMSRKSATRMRKVSSILRKKNDSLTLDDKQVLEENAELVEEYHKRREKRAVWQSRKTEQEDTTDILQAKCEELAQAIHDSEFLVVYTGAGISTAASIPDYRGPNGIWTLLQKGQDIGHHDLSAAEPTLTHMALSALYHQGIVRHVVSQNCDGLHLRSGLPKTAMSEVHGNMYIEVCIHCVPAREYVRTMDVTERTSTFKHTTGRRCYRCGEPLIDTIVHFGERGRLRWPLNWQGACQAANACDTILCLGSSLKVLKKYPWLWQMGRPPKKRPRLYIVNLQWTPKDKDATLKINGRCDEVMARVMKALGYKLPHYSKARDPIFTLATPLHPAEANTASRPCLMPPEEGDEEEEEEEEVEVVGDVETSNVACREVEEERKEMKQEETEHLREKESRKRKLESEKSEGIENKESVRREQESASEVKEEKKSVKKEMEGVESEIKEESKIREQDCVEREVKEESKIKEEDSAEREVKETEIRKQDSKEVKEEKEESQIREQDVKEEKEESVKSEIEEEKKETKAREQGSGEREVKKEEKEKEEERKMREQDNVEIGVKKEEEEGKISEQDSVESEVKERKEERGRSEQNNLENEIKEEEEESKESKIRERETESDVKKESKIREQDSGEREVKEEEEESRKRKLENVENEVEEENEESGKRKFERMENEVNGEKEENRKRKLDSLEREVKEEEEESRKRRLESIECEVKEEEEKEEEENRKRKLESEVKEENEESRKRKLESMEKEENRKRKLESAETEETGKRKLNSIENEIIEEKEENRKRKLDTMESEEKCEEKGTESRDHTNTKPINGLHITLSVEKFPLCPAQGGNIGVKYLKLDRSDPESNDLVEPKEEVEQEVDLIDLTDEAEEGREAGTLSNPGSRGRDVVQADSAGETCNSEGKGGQLVAAEEVCRFIEEGDQLSTTEKEVCSFERKGDQSDAAEEEDQLSTTEEKDVCTSERKGVQLGTTGKIFSIREADQLSTTEKKDVCSSEGKGDHLGTTVTEEVSSVGEDSGRLDTAEEEMCCPEEKGGQQGITEDKVESQPSTTDKEVCRPKEEAGQLGATEEMCCVEEEGGQPGATEEVCSIEEERGQLGIIEEERGQLGSTEEVYSVEDGDRLSTTEEKEACSSTEEGGQLGTTDEEEDVSSLKETGHPGTTDDEELSSLKEERGQLGTTDEEEGKSEPPDTDEDFHTFDLDPEPWEYAADVDVASLKSSASCCSDSESSEKGEDCQTEDSQVEDSQVEDSQTEDSDTGDSQHQKAEQVDYFKLAYASTNVQMARQGQALLKQNDFYGTGLCIRSCVSHTKTGERGSKGAGGGERLMLKGLQRARSKERREQCGTSSSPFTEEESDVSSLPNHCQAADPLSSSDSECPPCECGGKAAVSSPGGASDNPNSCSRCKNLSMEGDTCLSPDLLSVLGSVRVEVSGLGREQLSESQVTDGEPQLLSVNTDPQDAAQAEELVVKANSVLCHSELDLHPGQVGDGSFLLRTRVVDGIITTTCVEAMAKEAAGTSLVPCVSDSSSCNVPAACSSQGEVTSVSVPCLSLNQKGLMSAGSKPTFYIENSVSKAQVKAITEHLQSQRPGSKFSSELSTAESAELKSIWYQSFCGKNSDNNLSALTVMMEMNECNLGRGLSYVRPSNSEKSSSVILKNICAEAVNDSAAQHRNSTKKLKGSDDENVKCLWFWGFDSSAEGKEKAAAAAEAEAVEVVESTPEEDVAAEDDECHPVRRVTRSRTRASCDTANQAPPEEEGFKCHCSGSNPELCRIASLRPSRGKCDEDIQRARDIIRRRRTCNYRRYEPVFEKKLVSLTYERTRAKRKSKFDAPPVTPLVPMATHEEEEEEEDHEGETKEEEQKVSDGEECRERDEKGERKFSPGWYGKGLRKGMKKKTRV
ncbi:uncharacterized protein LOC126999356 isoform X2 [Eriocheir sinensis]|uniref:uncharacterized protein LOC126999356 isoform X2 n=1 Tax=Eriocheir sinensis TaxID=95602 RepID=UPI0021C7FDCA|nr:uncharacterized protein LOC126999356 isoform X2 [Eriocheir sinensis]